MSPTPFHLYSTLSRKKAPFVPREVGKVGMYVCGMTVYDDCHLGHARVMLFFDMMTKFLTQQGWQVRYIRNITDIDDKIINRAAENNEVVDALTKRVIASMHQDSDDLGMQLPTLEPRATHHMGDIIAFIVRLLEQDIAYSTPLGNVYFDVSKHPNYGALSGKKLDELLTGVRVEVETDKRQAADFALWKAADAQPFWDVPWSDIKGRPGWHIECSAMAKSCLGDTFDIHGGGPDLVFPHHENEIAQSEMANQCAFANYWMHVGSLQVDEKKMSKSLGNFITIKNALADYPAEVIRYCVYSTHYRKPLNYTTNSLLQSKQSLTKLLEPLATLGNCNTTETLAGTVRAHPLYQQWLAAMVDDFNTPLAFAVLFKMAKAIKSAPTAKKQQMLRHLLLFCAAPFGIVPKDGVLEKHVTPSSLSDDDIMRLLNERNQARQNKDFQAADAVRDTLAASGVLLKDNTDGTTNWTRK